jgi:hypothetical protein
MTILPATRFRLAALTVRETGAITAADVKGFPFTPAGGVLTVTGVATLAGVGAKILHSPSPTRAAVIGGAVAAAAIMGRYVWDFLGQRSAPTS